VAGSRGADCQLCGIFNKEEWTIMKDNEIAFIGIAGCGLVLTYMVMRKGLLPSIFGDSSDQRCSLLDLTCHAETAGKQTGEMWTYSTQEAGGIFTGVNQWATQTRAQVQMKTLGVGIERVPVTPSGFSPSNWTWEGSRVIDAEGDVVKLGLPASMTPTEFCEGVDYSSPICQSMFPTKKAAASVNAFAAEYQDPTMVA
jgi:hypothetical protein